MPQSLTIESSELLAYRGKCQCPGVRCHYEARHRITAIGQDFKEEKDVCDRQDHQELAKDSMRWNYKNHLNLN